MLRSGLVATVLLLVLAACTERDPVPLKGTEVVDFRIALRSQLPRPGDVVGSGEYEVLNQHSFPVTLGEPGRVVSVSDGVVLEASWKNAKRHSNGNPNRESLVLTGFSWKVHNDLVVDNDTWRTKRVTYGHDAYLTSTWGETAGTTPLAIRPGKDDPRAWCMQWRWTPGRELSAEPFDILAASAKPQPADEAE